jgi:hypothetical protein
VEWQLRLRIASCAPSCGSLQVGLMAEPTIVGTTQLATRGHTLGGERGNFPSVKRLSFRQFTTKPFRQFNKPSRFPTFFWYICVVFGVGHPGHRRTWGVWTLLWVIAFVFFICFMYRSRHRFLPATQTD